MKTVEVIIPTYKPDTDLKKLLLRLGKQTYPLYRVSIVNTEKAYWREELLTDALRAGLPVEVEHIEKGEFDHGGTRAMMAKKSQADYLLFMTQDAYPRDSRLVEELVKAFADTRVAAAYARQIPKKGCSLQERLSRAFNYPAEASVKSREDLERLGIKTYFCSNVCAMYRRDVYMQQGGFVTHTIFNEDMIFAAGLISAGYSIAYVPEAMVFHSHNYTIPQYFRRSFDMAVSQACFPQVFARVRSEKEGMRLVRAVTGRLVREKKIPQLLRFYLQCAAKYAGYFLGKRYEMLPEEVLLLCSENRNFWSK